MSVPAGKDTPESMGMTGKISISFKMSWTVVPDQLEERQDKEDEEDIYIFNQYRKDILVVEPRMTTAMRSLEVS